MTGFALAPLLTHESLKAGLARLFDLAVRGELKVTVGGSYLLGSLADAHRDLEGRIISVERVRFQPGRLDAVSTGYADRSF